MSLTIAKTLPSSLLEIVDMYLDATGSQMWTARQVAQWAIDNGYYDPQESAVSQCARAISRACREDYFVDKTGRSIRARHVARIARKAKNGEKRQQCFWVDIRRATRPFMQRAFQQRRMQIVGECRQLKNDVDWYNNAHKSQPPIQMVFDFTYDMEEMDYSPGTAVVRKPR